MGNRKNAGETGNMGNNRVDGNKDICFINKKRTVSAIAGFAVFAAISFFVITRDVLVFDTAVREYIYSLRSDGLTAFFRTVTCLGNWQTITLICLLFLLIPRMRISFGIPVSAAAILASLIQKALKVTFHRARPDLALHLISQGGYSFPSGHSFTVLIFYGMIIYLCRSNMKSRAAANLTTALLACLIPLIGFSRIYLGVHFPTDVLGGWSIGLCVLMVMVSAVLFFKRQKNV